MEPGKTLLVSFDATTGSKAGNEDGIEDSLTKDISLDYSEDEEMRSEAGSPTNGQNQEQGTESQGFDPVDDVDIFAVDEAHVDTSGGEIRRKAKFEVIFDAEKLGGPPNIKRYMNPKLANTDEFAAYLESDEQRARRVERAKRFGLDIASANEPMSNVVPLIDEPTRELLNRIYGVYGIDPENQRHKARFRLNSIYLRGVSKMSTENIFEYFGSYKPSYLEWIDDNSCNVVWADRTAAARALLGLSKPLRRVWPSKTSRVDIDRDKELSDNEELASPLKRGSLSEKDSCDASLDAEEVRKEENISLILDDEEPVDVDVSQLTVPPGAWRVGKDSQTSQIVLFRFSTVDDMKTPGAHRKSRYYREHGNPNLGGQTGLVSRSYLDRVSRKRRRSVEQDDTDVGGSVFQTDLRKTITDRARWSLLRDDVRRSQDLEPGELVEEEDLETGEVKLTYFSSDDDEDADDPEARSKKPRMRMRADEEEGRKQSKRRQLQRVKTSRHRDDSIDGDWRSSQRVPRDLRGILESARMKVTVPNERGQRRDARDRLESKWGHDQYEDDNRRNNRW